MNTQEKLNMVTKIAKEDFDGHFTLMKFTTNWSFTFGTVSDRDDIDYSVKGESLDEVLEKAISSRNSVHDGVGTTLSDIYKALGIKQRDELNRT